jgi:hypothetical protein
MAHQLQDKENKQLIEKKGLSLGEEDEELNKEEKKDEEEMEEELVDFDDSQDKHNEQEEEDFRDSQESFTTKVKKYTSSSRTRAELIKVKLEHERNKSNTSIEEPRRCPRLKDQEDANMTELAMKRAEKKNEIPGTNDYITPTILNSSDNVLVEMKR